MKITSKNINQIPKGRSVHIARLLKEEHDVPITDTMEILLEHGVLNTFAKVERLTGLRDTLRDECQRLRTALDEALSDCDVCITTTHLRTSEALLKRLEAICSLNPWVVDDMDEVAVRFMVEHHPERTISGEHRGPRRRGYPASSDRAKKATG